MVVSLVDRTPEVMGLFGLTWSEKVAAFMQKRLKSQGKAEAKKLSDFFQAGGKNVTLVKNLHNEYMALMAKGTAPVAFDTQPDSAGNGGTFSPASISLATTLSTKTNVDATIVLEFLRGIFVLARDGKIPAAKWNPTGYKASTALRKTYSTEKGLLETATTVGKTAANYTTILLVIAGIGVGAYFLSQVNKVNR